ncbi:MAG: MMPL family transporter [Spirochaetes bacterium]|nr:MMPL family transporter [Spirochaetota bacterium]
MRKFFKRPWLIVTVIGVITVFFALQLPKAEIDNNNFRFVPEKDPERLTAKKIDDIFGGQIMILVGLERKSGTILDADFIGKLRSLSAKISDIKNVDSVSSIVSTTYIDGVGDSIVASPLLPEDFKGTKAELSSLKERLLSWDVYRRALISDDFSSTQVVVSLRVGTDKAGTPLVIACYNSIKRLAYETGFESTNVYMAGLPVLSAEVSTATSRDLFFLVPLVVIVLLAVLFLSLKRLSAVFLPLLTVLISAVWAVGAMPLFGVKLTILSTVLPVILIAVGSAYGIHVVSHYYDEIAKRGSLSGEEHKDLVFAVMKRIGWPVFLAAATTFVGFVSFCFTSVVPIFDFGIFSSFGVLVAFIVAVTFIPAIFLIRGPEKAQPKSWGKHIVVVGENTVDAAIADAFGVITRKRRTTITATVLIVIVSLFGLSQVVIDNVLVEYFKPDTEMVRADKFIREKFGGTKDVSIVVTGEKPGDVLRPDVLSAMDGLSTYLTDQVPEIGKTIGFTDTIKRVNQVLNVDADPAGLPKKAAAQTAPVSSAGESEPAFGFGFDVPAETSTAKVPAAKAKVEVASLDKASATAQAAGANSKALAGLLDKALAESGTRSKAVEDLVRGFEKVVNYKGASYYEIPTDPARYGLDDAEGLKNLVSNYLVLLSGNLGSYADDPLEPKNIRMSVQMKTVGQIDTDKAIGAMKTYITDHFPKDVKVVIGGTALVEGSLNRLVVLSQLISVLFSLFLVFLILTMYYRSFVAGLIGIAPLSVSILINFAVMGFTGIKLNIGTAMVASITVGIGVDYTIHYMAAYHHEYLATDGKGDYLRRSFMSSGKVILLNAMSVGLGFGALAFSQFNILADLGKLILLTMATSSFVSLTLLPVLLEVIKPAFIRRPLPSEKFDSTTEVAS